MMKIKLIDNGDIHCIIPLLTILNSSIDHLTLQIRLDAMVKQGYRCVGVYDEERLIGISGLWILTKYYVGKHLEPDNVIIHPDYRGKGLGKILMQWIYNYAREEGCVASELNCYVDNVEGQKFWEHEGYVVIGKHAQKKL